MANLQHSLKCLILLCLAMASFGQSFLENTARHKAKVLPVELKVDFAQTSVQLLKNTIRQICIPRVVGTPGHARVRKYIVNSLKALGWQVSIDTFVDQTPTHGLLEFNNIISTYNANATRFLVFSCHYDTKYFKDIKFEGATDSAVPCAMLLRIAAELNDLLQSSQIKPRYALKLIFFDGEEAFKEWGPRDSIYGARNLAKVYSKQIYSLKSGQKISMIDRISLFVLLDLLGAPDPQFFSYFQNTAKWYTLLHQTEYQLSQAGALYNYSSLSPNQPYFIPASSPSRTEDDHLPFLRRNVPVLHLIPTPYPDVWHTEDDNSSNVDLSTSANLLMIFKIFIAEYLHLL